MDWNYCLNTLTSDHYIALVCDLCIYLCIPCTPTTMLFMQDNVACHKAQVAQNCFEKLSGDFQQMMWSPFSPDRSPIEHLWNVIAVYSLTRSSTYTLGICRQLQIYSDHLRKLSGKTGPVQYQTHILWLLAHPCISSSKVSNKNYTKQVKTSKPKEILHNF